MADLVPDPATRDLLADILRNFYEKGHPGQECIRSGWVPVTTYEKWRDHLANMHAAIVEPPEPELPPEPPDGAVLPGANRDLWQRDDSGWSPPGTKGRHWWVAGLDQAYTWAEAYEKGADPSRRLVELPDWRDEAAIDALERHASRLASDCYEAKIRDDAAWVVRALTERGTAT